MTAGETALIFLIIRPVSPVDPGFRGRREYGV